MSRDRLDAQFKSMVLRLLVAVLDVLTSRYAGLTANALELVAKFNALDEKLASDERDVR